MRSVAKRGARRDNVRIYIADRRRMLEKGAAMMTQLEHGRRSVTPKSPPIGEPASERKDDILSRSFRELAGKVTSDEWTTSPQPYTDLLRECSRFRHDPGLARALDDYLRRNTIVRRAVTMFFTAIAMAARADWASAPEDIRSVVARGWFLGRWLPTFLLIDGPVGWLLSSPESPLHSTDVRATTPVLASVRRFIQGRDFKLLRNGFAHWAFDWEVVAGESYVVAYDRERDLPTVKLHQREADAFHIITFAIIEALNETVLEREHRSEGTT